MKNNKYKIIIVEKEFNNLRLDKLLQVVFRNVNNTIVQKALRNKDILVNGLSIQNNYRLKVNDNIMLSNFILKILNSSETIKKTKKDIYISDTDLKNFKKLIIYKDKNILAINKTKGLAVQSGTKIEKSVNDFLKYLKYDENEVPKLVHRLDKDTSGVLILARNKNAAELLSEYFKNKDKNIEKIYLALVVGKFLHNEGEIKIPLLKKLENGVEKVYKDEKDGKEAITVYKVLDYSEKYNVSLLEIKLLTGRTHQIRVHMKEIGHPILGDGKYGSKKAFINGLSEDMHLHSYSMTINNFYGKNIKIKANIPQKFEQTVNELGFKI